MTNHHSSRKQVLAKKTTRLSLISTPNTLFCNSCALFAYGLSQHDPPASPKLELFSRSTSLTRQAGFYCVASQSSHEGVLGRRGLADNSKHNLSELGLHHVWHTTVVVSQRHINISTIPHMALLTIQSLLGFPEDGKDWVLSLDVWSASFISRPIIYTRNCYGIK